MIDGATSSRITGVVPGWLRTGFKPVRGLGAGAVTGVWVAVSDDLTTSRGASFLIGVDAGRSCRGRSDGLFTGLSICVFEDGAWRGGVPKLREGCTRG